jgi:hypothetical protein
LVQQIACPQRPEAACSGQGKIYFEEADLLARFGKSERFKVINLDDTTGIPVAGIRPAEETARYFASMSLLLDRV